MKLNNYVTRGMVTVFALVITLMILKQTAFRWAIDVMSNYPLTETAFFFPPVVL